MKYSIVQGTTDTPFCRDINTFVYITQMPCPESAIDDGVEFRRVAVCKEFSDANSLACAYSRQLSGTNEWSYSTISIDDTGVKDQIRRYAMPMIQNVVHIPGSKNRVTVEDIVHYLKVKKYAFGKEDIEGALKAIANNEHISPSKDIFAHAMNRIISKHAMTLRELLKLACYELFGNEQIYNELVDSGLVGELGL